MFFSSSVRHLRHSLLLILTIATVLLALPSASGARTHKSSGCHATTTAHKSAVRKCVKPAHKAKPSHTAHHPSRPHHKHKTKHHRATGAEEAEEEGENGCEENAAETSSNEEPTACEAPEEEQES